jgi:hypothetical protein
MMSSSTVTISALIRSNGWCIVVSGGSSVSALPLRTGRFPGKAAI